MSVAPDAAGGADGGATKGHDDVLRTAASRRAEMIRLVELDFDRTSSFIQSLVTSSAAIRGWAVTVWLAVLGVALSQRLWELGLLAAVVTGAFALIDGYHAWLATKAREHAQRLEAVSRDYFAVLSRGADDAGLEPALQAHLAGLPFGVYTDLPEKQGPIELLLEAEPRFVFSVLYPTLGVIGLAAAIFVAARYGVS